MKWIYSLLTVFSYLLIIIILSFVGPVILNEVKPSNSEYREGVAIILICTWPIWLGLPCFAYWFRRALPKSYLMLSVIPSCFMFALTFV